MQYINLISLILVDVEKDIYETFWTAYKIISEKHPRAKWNARRTK